MAKIETVDGNFIERGKRLIDELFAKTEGFSPAEGAEFRGELDAILSNVTPDEREEITAYFSEEQEKWKKAKIN